MLHLQKFTFNPFAENTYLVYDEQGQCMIVDPGMMDEEEDKVLFDFIQQHGLKPSLLVNTHCHLDHILGNASVVQVYQLPLHAHKNEQMMLDRAPAASLMWGVPYRESPVPSVFLAEGDRLSLGEHAFEIVFVPGHSPGHIALIHHAQKMVLAGDVLFRGSVGRVDLPGCNAQDLVHSIQDKLYALPDDYVVHPGHGDYTTIGDEKRSNAFIRSDWSGF